MRETRDDHELRGEGRFTEADKAEYIRPSAPQPHDDGEGHATSADEASRLVHSPSSPELPGEGRATCARKGPTRCANSGQPHSGEEGHGRRDDDVPKNSANLAATIALIRYQHRTRIYAMDQRKRADLSLGAFLRTALGWRKDLPDAERKRIAQQAAALIALGETEAKGKPVETDEPAYAEWRDVIIASIAARAPFDEIEKRAKKEMERLAKTLPVWQWAEGVKGFGAVSLAVIVGEAGNLGTYPKKGHLWRRMGLAPFTKGQRTRSGAQWRIAGGLTANDWVEYGYSSKRRSVMYVIGEALMKQQGHYRDVYLSRKAYLKARAEAAGRTVAPSAKIPKGKRDEYTSDGEINSQALYYMEKRLLRDLWQAWRRAGTFVLDTGPCEACPPPTLSEAA